ncbi:MAG: reverse transcriptase-like protein [Deltaproteobacteria bacterium]|nr:reverse transcriptase-like protein [Deltaproteobacteria bacterium]
MDIIAYTDGGARKDGRGAWAAILVAVNDKGKIVKRTEISAGVHETTNNLMELEAIYQAVSRIKQACRLKIVTDSQNAISWIEGSFKTRKAHIRLAVEKIKHAAEKLGVELEFEHIAGHSGIELNEYADQLCCRAIEELKVA